MKKLRENLHQIESGRGILSDESHDLEHETTKARILYERDRDLKIPPPLTSPFEVVPGLEKQMRDEEEALKKKKLGKLLGEPPSKEPDYLMT